MTVIEFHLETRSGVAPYLQLVQQVRRALRLGLLSEGDRLPTVKEVVASIAINPNTVLKAYRELEHEGLVSPRPGLGTFVTRTLADESTRQKIAVCLARIVADCILDAPNPLASALARGLPLECDCFGSSIRAPLALLRDAALLAAAIFLYLAEFRRPKT